MADAISTWLFGIYEKANPSNVVYGLLGDTAPQPSGGGAGHEQVVMPMRSPVLIWRGRPDLLTMTVPIMFDGHATDTEVYSQSIRLGRMFRPKDAAREPPVVRIDALGSIIPYKWLDWVITGLEWGTDGIASGQMQRTRQTHIVTLTEYVPDERITAQHSKESSAKRRKDSKARGNPSQSKASAYTVRSGDTLSGIAARLNVKGGWRALADAQKPPINDPRTLRVGQVLRLP